MILKRYENILIVSVLVFFVVVALFRLYPFDNTLPQIVADKGNDWGTYANYALDIKNNGFLMPSVNGVYEKPASFFYCYFLAASFSVFGENNIPVYILQSLMLGFSVIFLWLTFRNKISNTASFLFLISLVLFASIDVSIYYTFRDRKSTRLNSSHIPLSRMPSSA